MGSRQGQKRGLTDDEMYEECKKSSGGEGAEGLKAISSPSSSSSNVERAEIENPAATTRKPSLTFPNSPPPKKRKGEEGVGESRAKPDSSVSRILPDDEPEEGVGCETKPDNDNDAAAVDSPRDVDGSGDVEHVLSRRRSCQRLAILARSDCNHCCKPKPRLRTLSASSSFIQSSDHHSLSLTTPSSTNFPIIARTEDSQQQNDHENNPTSATTRTTTTRNAHHFDSNQFMVSGWSANNNENKDVIGSIIYQPLLSPRQPSSVLPLNPTTLPPSCRSAAVKEEDSSLKSSHASSSSQLNQPENESGTVALSLSSSSCPLLSRSPPSSYKREHSSKSPCSHHFSSAAPVLRAPSASCLVPPESSGRADDGGEGSVNSDTPSSATPERLVESAVPCKQQQQPSDYARDCAHCLPDEILRELFTYLPGKSRILVERVCSRWRRLSLDAWYRTRTLTMRDYRVRERRHPITSYHDNYTGGLMAYFVRTDLVLKRQDVKSVWQRAGPRVEAIDFTGAGTRANRGAMNFLHPSVTWELGNVMAPCLKSLVFDKVKVNALSLAEAFDRLSGLERLVLKDSFHEQTGATFSNAMAGLLSRSPGLRELRVTHSYSTCRWVANLPASIQVLDLSRTRSTGLRIDGAFDGTPDKYPALRTLDLSYVQVNGPGFNVARVCQSAPGLQHFNIQYMYCQNLLEPGAAALLPRISMLNFFHYDMTSQKQLILALTDRRAPAQKSLRQLFVNAEGLESDVVEKLGTLSNLERLCIGPHGKLKGSVIRELGKIPNMTDLLLFPPSTRRRSFSADESGFSDSESDSDF